MNLDGELLDFDCFGTDVVFGRGAIRSLESVLQTYGIERVLVVCGSNVGANRALMDPVLEGLGELDVGVFDETTAAKAVQTVYDGLDVLRQHDPDVVLGIGGGSSLDIARFITTLDSDGRTQEELRTEAVNHGEIRPATGDGPVTPVAVIPTTLAGADLSAGGSLVVSPADEQPCGQIQRLRIDDEKAQPITAFFDPAVFETTPESVLVGSAMNGFDKGIESIYAKEAMPISDATAIHGLRILRRALPKLRSGDPTVMDKTVEGLILIQFKRHTNVVHAFGHGFARRYPHQFQQGVVHGIFVPHVLEHLFEQIDARRDVLALGLGVDPDQTADAVAPAIIDEVVSVRDGLGVPSRLGEIDVVDEDDFPAIAEFIHDDAALDRGPEALNLSLEDINAIIERAK